jgi:hypothetical protein
MKDLNFEEMQSISGGAGSDLGEWLINKVGNFICKCKSFFKEIDVSNLKNYSHGTYPGNL